MRLFKFSSYDGFKRWFTAKRAEDFPMINDKHSHHASNKSERIFRVVKGCKTVGIIFYMLNVTGSARISLFEVNKNYHRQGIGKQMYRLLLKELPNPIMITLSYLGERGGEAYSFWKKMGFLPVGRGHEMRRIFRPLRSTQINRQLAMKKNKYNKWQQMKNI